jgi:hypothetical protein
MQTYYNQDGA